MNLGNNLSPPIYHLFTFLVRTMIGRFFLFRFPVRISSSCMRLSHSLFRVPPPVVYVGVWCVRFFFFGNDAFRTVSIFVVVAVLLLFTDTIIT